MLASIAGIFGNTIVLILFAKYKELRKNDCLYLIANLSFADLLNS